MTLGTLSTGRSSVATTTNRAGAAGSLSLLATQPVQSTSPQQDHGLKNSLDSGGSFRLSQNASSIFAETLGKFPWLHLVICLDA